MRDASAIIAVLALPSRVIDALSLSNDQGPKAAFRAAALLALDARGTGTTSEIGRDLDGTHPDPSKVVANVLKYLQRAGLWAPPHTRGSTRGGTDQRPQADGSPAHAGIDPAPTPSKAAPNRLPRTRGDRPPPRWA
jgi:hypothetical protein